MIANTSSKNNKALSSLAAWVFVLVQVGYPVFAAVPVYFELPNRVISVPYRGIVLGLALGIIVTVGLRISMGTFVQQNRGIKQSLFWGFWWGFWLLYLSRIWIDSFFNPEALKIPAWEYFIYAAGISLIPAVALSFKDIAFTQRRTIYGLVFVGTLGLSLSLLMIFLQRGYFDLGDFSLTRAETDTLGPIGIGRLAVTVAILSVWVLLSHWRELRTYTIIVLCGCIAISLVGLVASASRGPALSLFIILPLQLYAAGIRGGWLRVSLFCILVISAVIYNLDYFDSDNFLIVTRLGSSTFEDAERSRMFSEGFDLLIKNPFLGSGTEPLDVYPHNLILESFLIFGILSGGAFTFLLIYSNWKSFRLITTSQSSCWIVFLLIQQSILALLTGALYSSYELWGIMAVAVSEVSRRYQSKD